MNQGIALAEQPLQIQRGKSKVCSVTCPLQEEAIKEQLHKFQMRNAYVVVWQMNAIRWGKWENDSLTFPNNKPANVNLWLELRAFNEKSELYLVRQGTQLLGRFRCDDEGEEDVEYVDSLARFWGEKKKSEDGWMVIKDTDRKLSQIMPQPQQNARFYGLVTRNYIGINEKTAQAGYQDYRYVAVTPADVKGVD